jgi:peroxiredoxin
MSATILTKDTSRMKAERRQQSNAYTLLFIAGGLLVVAAIGLLLVNQSPSPSIEQAQIGQPLGDFSLSNLDGDTVRLSDYTGQVVLINAWATWCPPCVAEMPDLQAYYQAHRKEQFVILGINAGDSLSTTAAFVSQNGITFPILLDPNVEMLTSLGIHSFPTSILIGADGVVRSIHVGMFSAEELEAKITRYLR